MKADLLMQSYGDAHLEVQKPSGLLRRVRPLAIPIQQTWDPQAAQSQPRGRS